MWKLQPTTVFTEHRKPPVHQIALCAGTECFPPASQMCVKAPSAREANTVPPVPGTVGPIDVTALHVPSAIPENMGETLSAKAEDTKGMDAHTPKFACTLPLIKETCNFMKLCFPSLFSKEAG